MLDEIRQELRRFAETTGIKGIGRIVKTTSVVIRFFWLISILACSAILFFQVTKVLCNFTSHTVTRSSKVVQTTPTFPDVTICNLFPVYNMSSAGYKEFLRAIETMEQYDKELQIAKDSVRPMWSYAGAIVYYTVNTPIMEEILDSDDGFVVNCSQYGWDLYVPTPCKAKPVLTAPLQKCHTIELDWTNGSIAAVTVLIFTNNLQSQIIDGYNPWIRILSGTGAKVMIHPSGTIPNPKTATMVSTGNQVNILLKQNNDNRLPQPYGNCTDRDRLNNSQANSPNYSNAACISLCRQRQFIKRCSCLDYSEFFTEEDFNLVNGTFCFNFTQTVSEKPLLNETAKRRLEFMQCQTNFVPDQRDCDCPLPCTETYYDTTASSSQWPNPFYHLSFYKQFIKNNLHYGDKFSKYEEILKNAENQTEEETLNQIKSLRLIEDNFLEVLIVFTDDTIQMYTDSAAITWDTLVANLGGSFNLWLGICVPTVAEIIELIYSLFVIVCCKRKANVIEVVPAEKKPTF